MTDQNKQQETTKTIGAEVENDTETTPNKKIVEETPEEKENKERTVEEEGQEKEATDDEMDEKSKKIKSLEETIEKLTEEIDLLKRAAADLKNRNRQYELDKKYAESGLVKDLLVPLSYFEGALNVKTDDEKLQNFLKGFEMIYNLLFDQLYQCGLKEIEVKVNEPFDPKVHEVFELVDSEESDGMIQSLVQKGYYFKDRVIKPAQVRVTRLVKSEKEETSDEKLEKSEKIVQ